MGDDDDDDDADNDNDGDGDGNDDAEDVGNADTASSVNHGNNSYGLVPGLGGIGIGGENKGDEEVQDASELTTARGTGSV